MSPFKRALHFLAMNEAEARNKKYLKKIASEIKQNKYRKLYKPISGEITPAFGSFFMIYIKFTKTAQGIMNNTEKSTLLKQIIIESFMDKNIYEINKRISLEAIEERSKTVAPQELSRQAEEDLAVLLSAFDAGQINEMDWFYTFILTFTQFVISIFSPS